MKPIVRRSIRVALWIVAIGVVVALVIGGGAAMVVWRHTTVSAPAAPEAARAFDQVRDRFLPRPPLVQIVDPGPLMMDVRVHRPPASAPRQAVKFFHVLAFDGRTKKLVRSRAPVWWMNFSAESLLARIGVPLGALALTVADVERYGPGVVLDFSPPAGGRVLVWVE